MNEETKREFKQLKKEWIEFPWLGFIMGIGYGFVIAIFLFIK